MSIYPKRKLRCIIKPINIIALPCAILAMYPGFLAAMLANGNYEKVAVSSLIALVAALFFFRNFNIYKETDGYLKSFFISTLLLSGNFSLPVWSSVSKSDASDLVFLLLLPLIFIVNYLLTKSSSAKQAVAVYQRVYNKKINKDT